MKGKRFLTFFTLLALMALTGVQASADSYVSRSVVSAAGSCVTGFAPDNYKQVVSRFVNATGSNAGDILHFYTKSARTTTDISPSAAGNTAGMTDLYTTATTNMTAGDFLFIYLISGASAGNYQIVKITSVSAGIGAILAANLTYTLPYGTYVYVCDSTTLGTVTVGNATKEISNAGGWLAAPSDSPLIVDFVGPAAGAMAINSIFCAYQ